MRSVVLASPSADARSGRALSRALERFPATVEEVPQEQLAARLRVVAAAGDVAWIVVIDADAVPEPTAFASLQRAFATGAALVGGRAVVGETQRLGSMFGPPRSGPNPFQLVPLAGSHADGQLTKLVRGPVDAPQRGLFIVAADFVRSIASGELDPVRLHLDLAVQARAAKRLVFCEPSMSFELGEDSRELVTALGGLRRYARTAPWIPSELHRDPERLRAHFITREMRIMGNYRGFVRQPCPPIDVLAIEPGEGRKPRGERSRVGFAGAASVTVCERGDGDALRAALALTGDRYVLVFDAAEPPDRAAIEPLIERIERDSRTALVVARTAAPFVPALFHCGRIANGPAFRGATVDEVIADAIARLPSRGLTACGVSGRLEPPAAATYAVPRTLDVVFVAASKPTVTHQTLQAVLSQGVTGTTWALYPAGAATTERLFAVHSGLRLLPDPADVHLATGLNRALGAVRSDVVAIVRDDVQIPRGFLTRLQAAFGRIPRLGAVVPRVGGADRPEALPDQSYRNSGEMQAIFDRRGEAYARETMMMEVATTPVIMVTREALDVVGGFDEMFGFSRVGVEDFTRRLRSANFLVGCCEDAYAHVFPFAEAASFIANIDDRPALRAAYETHWSARRGFDPARDRVPLRTEAAPVRTAPDGLRILAPLESDDDWQRARALLVELAAAFRVYDPVEVAIGLDGTFGLQTTLSEVRELLLGSGIPMEETLNISIDFVPDIVQWRDSGEQRTARLAGLEREGLEDLPVVDGAAAVRSLFTGVGV